MEGFAGSQLLIQPEAEGMIKDIKPFAIEDVGTRAWQTQRKRVEQLNCQAHYNTSQDKNSDFVTEALLSEDKVSILIHELLVMEQWRTRVYPLIRDDLLTKNPTCVYTLLYYESVLANLLELVFWHEEGITRADDDLLEVLDYLWRNIVMLNTYAGSDDYWPDPSDMEEATSKDPKRQEAYQKKHKFDSERRQQFTLCMTSISLLWYIVDKVKVLPMAALNNILKKNDMPVGLTVLLDNRPWLRRTSKGMEKFKTKEWVHVSGADLMVVCEYEAHTWFLLHTLLSNPGCREKYQYTTWRKEQILKARKFLNEVLVDQIPPLSEVQRALDELSFLEPPSSVEEKFKTTLVIEPCPRIMDSITKRTNFTTVAKEALARLSDPATVMEQSKEMSAMLDMILGMDLGEEGGEGLSEEAVQKLLTDMKASR